MQRKHIVLFVATLSLVAFDLILYSYPIISGSASKDLRLSYTQSGLVTSVFPLAYALMQVPGGYLADRFGGTRTLFVFLLVAGVSPFLFVLGGTFSAALFSRIVAGTACGVIFPSSVRVVSSWFSESELDSAMSVFGSGMGSAQIVASLFLPLLVVGGDWSPPLIFTALFALIVAAFAFFPARWSSANVLRIKVKVDVKGLFTRNMLALMLPNFVALAVMLGVFAWAPIFLTSTLHLSTAYAGAVLASIGVANIIGCFAGVIANERFGKRSTIALSMLLVMIFSALLGTSSSGVMAAIWIFGVGFASSLYFAADFALIPYAASQGIVVAGITFGVFNTLSNVGGFLSPILLGFILDSTKSFPLAFVILSIIAVPGLIGSAILRTDRLNLAPEVDL